MICKRLAHPDDHLQKVGHNNNNNKRGDGGVTRVTGATRGDGTEGGEEGKGEGGEEGG